jgi:hypothetical protein
MSVVFGAAPRARMAPPATHENGFPIADCRFAMEPHLWANPTGNVIFTIARSGYADYGALGGGGSEARNLSISIR